jgi:putative NADH-flavin reductase
LPALSDGEADAEQLIGIGIIMRVVLFGATGPTGKFLIDQALVLGYQVVVYGRNASRVKVSNDAVTLITGQLGDPAAVAEAISGADAVISALGPGFKSPAGNVIARSVENIIAGMKLRGVKRLIQVTTVSVSDERGMSLINFLYSLLAKNTYDDVRETARVIRRSGLDWTIVRVPRLYDGPVTNNLKVGYNGLTPFTLKLSRGNLARFIFRQLAETTYSQQAPGLSN